MSLRLIHCLVLYLDAPLLLGSLIYNREDLKYLVYVQDNLKLSDSRLCFIARKEKCRMYRKRVFCRLEKVCFDLLYKRRI